MRRRKEMGSEQEREERKAFVIVINEERLRYEHAPMRDIILSHKNYKYSILK